MCEIYNPPAQELRSKPTYLWDSSHTGLHLCREVGRTYIGLIIKFYSYIENQTRDCKYLCCDKISTKKHYSLCTNRVYQLVFSNNRTTALYRSHYHGWQDSAKKSVSRLNTGWSVKSLDLLCDRRQIPYSHNGKVNISTNWIKCLSSLKNIGW